MASAKCNDLTLTQKKEICDYKQKHPTTTQELIAKLFLHKWKFRIARRTVGNILERKCDWTAIDSHQSKAKRARKPKFAVLEEALAMWFSTMQAKKAIITDAILIEKAKNNFQRDWNVRISHHLEGG